MPKTKKPEYANDAARFSQFKRNVQMDMVPDKYLEFTDPRYVILHGKDRDETAFSPQIYKKLGSKNTMGNVLNPYNLSLDPNNPEDMAHFEDWAHHSYGKLADYGWQGLSWGNFALHLPETLGRAVLAPAAEVGRRLFSSVPERDTYFSTNRIGTIDKSKIPGVMEAWHFCLNSYRPGVEVPGFKYTWLTFNDENAGYVAIRYNDANMPEDIVFAFRGTQSKIDIAEDATSGSLGLFKPISSYAGVPLEVSISGAYAPFKRIVGLEEQIKPFIDLIHESPNSIRNILVTGHSLGGGTAAIFAAILIQIIPNELCDKTRCVTFEAMRGLTTSSLNGLLRTARGKMLDENSLRIVNDKDPVPNVPPRLSGFSHLGHTWLLAGDLTKHLHGKSFNLNNVFNVNVGPHSMVPTDIILAKFARHAISNPNFDEMAYEVSGRGLMKKRRKRKTWLKKGSIEAKTYMAHLRSMRRK